MMTRGSHNYSIIEVKITLPCTEQGVWCLLKLENSFVHIESENFVFDIGGNNFSTVIHFVHRRCKTAMCKVIFLDFETL